MNPTSMTCSTPSETESIQDSTSTNNKTTPALHDTQAGGDQRGIRIDRVGVKDVKFPFQLKMQDGSLQPTIGLFSLYVELPEEERGTHMSRFMELLHASANMIDPGKLTDLCKEMQQRLHAPAAHIEVECTFFLKKPAPVTGVESLLDYQLFMSATTGDNIPNDTSMKITAPAKSLCPCSKEISDYGAHNQRSEISAHVRHNQKLHLEELVEMAEDLCKQSDLQSVETTRRTACDTGSLQQPEIRGRHYS